MMTTESRQTSSLIVLIGFLLLPSPAVAQTQPAGADDPGLRSACLRLVDSIFLKVDPEAVAAMIDEQAEWKKYGPGSASEVVRDMNEKADEFAPQIRLREVHFFTRAEMRDKKEQFSSIRFFEEDRLPAHLQEDDLACLIVHKHLGQNRIYHIVFVMRKSDEDYRAVYFDDH